ncbi:DUF6173 family protein [Pontiellaceae bacterium B12219]|nr:DUF6173 family protein [Pontiellaceae bacterium B12219]
MEHKMDSYNQSELIEKRKAERDQALRKAAQQAHKMANPVIGVCESLKEYIQEFEQSLDPDQEVGANLVSFGQSITFHINQLSFSTPDIVTFYGTTENGDKVQLIQHVSQLSVLLIAVKRIENKPKEPIGFNWK